MQSLYLISLRIIPILLHCFTFLSPIVTKEDEFIVLNLPWPFGVHLLELHILGVGFIIIIIFYSSPQMYHYPQRHHLWSLMIDLNSYSSVSFSAMVSAVHWSVYSQTIWWHTLCHWWWQHQRQMLRHFAWSDF